MLDNIRVVTKLEQELFKRGAFELELLNLQVFLLDRARLFDELVLRDLFASGNLNFLLLHLIILLLGEGRLADDVGRILAPFPGVNRQLREHDTPEHLLLVSLEAKAQDLEADA